MTARSERGSREANEPYQAKDFDAALIKAVQLGLSGDPAGMRQLLDRLLRRPIPAGRKSLRDKLALAVAQTTTPFVPFRRAEGVPDAWASYEGPIRVADEPLAAPPGASSVDELKRDTPEGLTIADSSEVLPILRTDVARELEELVQEHQHSARLIKAGLAPTRTLLLTGVPGTGKTHTARWIASILHRPLITLDLAKLIAHELGRSARNLHAAFRFAARSDTVFFIDELDAIGKSRSDSTDVGEIKRVVSALLLELDQWPDNCLLVAATNHPELLDHAISRRFEHIVELPIPDYESRQQMIQRFAPGLINQQNGAATVELVAGLMKGMTGADLRRVLMRSRRTALLQGLDLEDQITRDIIQHRTSLSNELRDQAVAILNKHHYSQRRIASLLGITHPTVGKILRESNDQGHC